MGYRGRQADDVHDTLSLVQEVLKPVRDGLQEVGRNGDSKDSGLIQTVK
ncbi:hypothetical protein [Aeribacillus composti]|nr:hypothetical protein [Aeribacillus composti]